MIIENPHNIKKADILIGIPTYNEAENIGFITEQIDRGLSEYFSDRTKVIINVDNHSTDQTRESFFEAKGDVPKIYNSTRPSFRGKGYNIYNFLLMMQQMEAEAGVVLDADLKSVTPQWIDKMVKPILQGHDFLAPYYDRLENEATITNHLAYPLTYGLVGYNLRQPIGGDYAFSDKMSDWWLKQRWSAASYAFGVDIFLSLHALLSETKCGQVQLGAKIHRMTKPISLDRMFGQVTESLFNIVLDNIDRVKNQKTVYDIAIIQDRGQINLEDIRPDYAAYKKIFYEKYDKQIQSIAKVISKDLLRKIEKLISGQQIIITADLWADIVYDLLAAYRHQSRDFNIIESLKCFYFGRVASFFAETADFTPKQTEKEIIRQAKIFFDKRHLWLAKLS